jgi:hypothetical protein
MSIREYVPVVKDVLRLAPFLGWAIMSITSIPEYSHLGWTAPVVSAVFSIILCCCAAYAMWRRAKTLRGFIHIQIDLDDLSAPGSDGQRTRRIQIGLALFFAAVAWVWAGVSLGTYYTYVAPALDDEPCGGKCETCVEDPNCRAWVAALTEQHPILRVCPTVRDGAQTDANFSCQADGFWLLLTGAIALLWGYLVYSVEVLHRADASTKGGVCVTVGAATGDGK